MKELNNSKPVRKNEIQRTQWQEKGLYFSGAGIVPKKNIKRL